MTPAILTEDETIDAALAGRSLSRVGEGELKYAVHGWDIKSQAHDPRLGNEIKAILTTPGPALACLPKARKGMPNETFWRRFEVPAFTRFYKLPTYGGAFISRPDVAPHIDRPDYWEKVRALWAGRDVTLAGPSPKTLKMPEAASVRFVETPPVQAYAHIDRIEEEIGQPSGPVFLVIGATATALAARLAKRGVWALDVGHLGHFMAAAGSFSLDPHKLISPAYVEQNRRLHAAGAYGKSGRHSCADVLAFAAEVEAFGMLDYGSGQGTLKTALVAAGFKGPIEEYDPAIKGRDRMPKPADLVLSTDVLEHIEPDKLSNVLRHMRSLAKKAAFFNVATRPASKRLPDGRNAHLIIEDAEFWSRELNAAGFRIVRTEVKAAHSARFWCLL